MSDLENTIAPLDQVDFDCEATLQLVRQTGGAGKVVSNYTVFDRNRSHDVLTPAGIIAVAPGFGEPMPSLEPVPAESDCARISLSPSRRAVEYWIGEWTMTRDLPTAATVNDFDLDHDLSSEDQARAERIAGHVRSILGELQLDLDDPNLQETDIRVAKMYLEMFHGLREGSEPKVTTFPNDESYEHMVMERDIPFYSMCSHHLVPFYGQAHIAYIPRDKIIGLSKFSRILEFYAKRPQLQERLTEQVVGYLENTLNPLGAMVVIEARHLCVEMRGVKKPGALTVTSAIRGAFHQRPVREEFLDLLKRD